MVDEIIGNTKVDHNDSLWDISLQALAAGWARTFRQGRNDDRQLVFSVHYI